MNEKVEKLTAKAGGLTAFELLELIVGEFGDKVSLASSFSAEDQVLTDMLSKLSDSPKIFTLDTGRLPEQTYNLIDETRNKYALKIKVLFPDSIKVEQMVNSRGVNLFYDSIAGRKLCCRVRKVEPLKRELSTLDAWICGLRVRQAVTRSRLDRIEWDNTFDLIKISPLADWTEGQIWDYIVKNDVPYNRLHDQGYPSIGCAPCTRAVSKGEDIRSGRWWWESPEHKECGLHLHPQG